jgi:hypothetical protein
MNSLSEAMQHEAKFKLGYAYFTQKGLMKLTNYLMSSSGSTTSFNTHQATMQVI